MRLLNEELWVRGWEGGRMHLQQIKSLFQLLKLEFHGHWETLFHTRLLIGPARFKYQCIDQDNLVQLLGPFQHDRNFTNFFATVYCYLKITATHLNINNLWRGQATRAVFNAVKVLACVPVSQVSLCFYHLIMFTKRQNQYREAVIFRISPILG